MRKIIIVLFLLIPILALAQENTPQKTAYFFYLDTCSHCHNVDKYFAENGLYDKYDIKKLNAAVSANGKFMMDLYAANNFPEDQRGGVPVVAFGEKFFVGDKPIIENFVKEIDAAENTNQSPNPPADILVHDGPISSTSEAANEPIANSSGGKSDTGKKNYFPLAVAAFVIIGAGILILSNRKS